jgi:hypothetical protein
MKIGSYVTKYRVTIHDHVIYDYWVEAPSKQDAIGIAEDSIANDEKHLWSVDETANWSDIGDVYNEYGEEV